MGGTGRRYGCGDRGLPGYQLRALCDAVATLAGLTGLIAWADIQLRPIRLAQNQI